MEKYVGNWDQRKDVQNGENDDGMCEKCCGAGPGTIQIYMIFYKELHRDVHSHPVYSMYI